MSRKNLHQLRRHLECKLAEANTSRAKRTDLVIVPSADPVEDAQSKVSIDLAVRAINDDWQIRRELRSAVQRIDRGEYGICEACGEQIARNRLRAIPWAAMCTACQASREAADASAGRFRDVA